MEKLSNIELLESLVNIPSPSGYEREIADFIYAYISQFVSQEMIEVDKYNNVIVTFNNDSDKTVMVDTHSDEIGFMISNVDRWGSISLQYIGGGDSTILSARHLNILSKKGVIPAVVDRKHAHLVIDEDEENIYSPEDADVDIGIRDREKILKLIQIGDPVVYNSTFRKLIGDYVTGYGLDDKSGCIVLMKSIEQIAKSNIKPNVNIVYVFSAQEETGTSKLFPVVHRIKPDLVIEADVTFATDYGQADGIEKGVGRCELGKGTSLYRGVDIDEDCFDLAVEIAKKKKIPYQVQASCGNIGYTSLTVTNEGEGAKAMVFGIPLRSMHAPTEIIHMDDLKTGANLLTLFLQNKKLKTIL
ncbi:MAG: M20/M25/M40 family metallo-hydrolase [Candidatus Izimaplasma sp.]|nr:M20/M25/M40 family metallo-hydrolase [Candidatus Izimaplasma bacterium]